MTFDKGILLGHAAVTMAFLGVFGCGPTTSLEKVIVSGEVTYNGAPIANGDVLFYPMPGTTGPMSGASIKDGRYMVDAKGGVPVGEHLVRINGFRSSGGPQSDDMRAAKPGGERIQYIPTKYNEQSELIVKIGGEESEITYDFKLTD
jgi:hypothetical protein